MTWWFFVTFYSLSICLSVTPTRPPLSLSVFVVQTHACSRVHKSRIPWWTAQWLYGDGAGLAFPQLVFLSHTVEEFFFFVRKFAYHKNERSFFSLVLNETRRRRVDRSRAFIPHRQPTKLNSQITGKLSYTRISHTDAAAAAGCSRCSSTCNAIAKVQKPHRQFVFLVWISFRLIPFTHPFTSHFFRLRFSCSFHFRR